MTYDLFVIGGGINGAGIARDAARDHRAARPRYERSRAYEVEPQIPAYNLARSVALSGDYSEAHDLSQEALLLDPDLGEAHFNDGVILYFWGQADRGTSIGINIRWYRLCEVPHHWFLKSHSSTTKAPLSKNRTNARRLIRW